MDFKDSSQSFQRQLDGLKELQSISFNSLVQELDELEFQIEPIRSWHWVVTSVKTAGFYALFSAGDPTILGNREIAKQLKDMSITLENAAKNIMTLDPDIRQALFSFAVHTELDVTEFFGNSTPAHDGRFEAATRELRWLAEYMRQASEFFGSDRQKRGWKQKEVARQRVAFGHLLSTTFSQGFQLDPVAGSTDGQDASHLDSMKPWSKFYLACRKLLFPKYAYTNFPGDLKEARKRFRQNKSFIATDF